MFDSTYNRLRYTYDAKGQLITDIINHNELPSGIAHQYIYDKYGNIESYKVNGNTVHTFTYDEYNRMITFDNKTVTYNDNDGMISLTPSTIGDDTYSWQGRRLMSISGTKNIQFEYNEQGLRTFKRVDTGQTLNSNKIYKDYEYVYDLDNKLICQRVTYLNSIDTMIFLYHDDHLYGFEYAQSKYFYLRDSLGNINGIIDSTGKLVVEYVYNAFGKIIDILGEMKDTIGVNNPMRYKGYYYDSETQLFYCNSRYYSPELCRFISPDSIEYLDPLSINGLNLYCYCMNNPIMYTDPSGHMPEWLGDVLTGLAIIAGTALVVTALTFTGGTVAAFFLAVGKTALLGLEIAAVAGVTSGAIRTGRSLAKNISEGNNFSETIKNAGKSFLAGFGDGFLGGAQYYAGSALLSFSGCYYLGTINNGYGVIMPTYMIGYQNPNVLGFTLFASRIGSKFRVDLDPVRSFHYHYGDTKKERDIHRGSWLGGLIAGVGVGIYTGFNGEIY